MSWAISISESSLPPSPQPLDASNNLATGQFVSQAHWETYNNSPTCILGQGANAMGDLGASTQPPYATTVSRAPDTDLKVHVGYPAPLENIHASPSHGVPAPTGQINLATSSNFESCMRSTVPTYYHPAEFSPYPQNAYSQYPDDFSENQSEGAETSANAVSPGFAYGYTQTLPTVQSGCGMAQLGQSYTHNNFGCGNASLPNTQALNELYLSSEHANSFATEYPANASFSTDGYLERRALSVSVAEPQAEPTFIISFNGLPLAEDAWSSVAVSSPSLASYNSSPRASVQHDASALGTPVLEYEDASSPAGEPLLSVSHSMPELRRASSGSIADSISSWSHRNRRGAVSQRGRSMPASQADSSSQPMLNAVVASHLYTDEFGSDNGANPFGVSHPADDGYISAFSPTTPEDADFPLQPSAPVRPSLSSTSSNPATDSATEVGSSHSGQELPTKSERGTRGQSGGPRHHPYGRSTRMTAHEQVIQFDAPSVGSSDDVSDDQETSTRKKKKSKASKRCYCDYVCPIKGEPCGQSVSREADMSRHLQRHRRAEQDMVRDGILAPERQTVFDKLKSSEEVVCLGCGQHISRKDAFKRHLKNTGKACRPFYPDIVIVDRDD